MHSLIRILSSVKPLRPAYALVALCAVVVSLFSLATPFIIKNATDTIVEVYGGSDLAEASKHIVMLTLLLFVVQLGNTFATNFGGYHGDVMAAQLRATLSTRYYAQLLGMPQRYFDTQVTGTIIARLDRSISTMTQALQAIANNFFPMLITLGAVLVITGWYYWPLAVLLTVMIPIYMWLTAKTSVRWQEIEDEKNEHVDLAGGRFAEVIGQIKVSKSFVAETRELTGFSRHFATIVELTKKQSRWWHSMDFLRSGALNLIFFGIYSLLFYRTLHGLFTIGEMVLLIQLVTMARMPMTMMSWVVDTSQKAIAGSKSYFEVMDLALEPTANKEIVVATSAFGHRETDPQTIPAPIEIADNQPAIDFNNVTFSYAEGEQVLRGISFTAQPGEKIALVSESGGGKTTITNLLMGLYQPTAGSIRLGGKHTSELSVESLRASVGVVFQEGSLFSGTVAENIAYGKPEATSEEIEAVARRANAHDFIMDFPQGYDTTIGERGLRLSGGQKQRIAIARAMLKDAPILILDEATSALDTKAELAVQEGLEELMAGRTSLIIAHRLSTIAGVDTIVTLHKGSVMETGSPAELATTGGIYAELLQLTAHANEDAKKRLKEFGFSSD